MSTHGRNSVKCMVYGLIAMLLCCCDVIRDDEHLIEVPLPHGSRAHVLVDYTGFRCVNCPTAHRLAQELTALYNPYLITVSMHPASNPFTQGLYDYTCPEADVYYQFMGGTSTTAFPTGNVDFADENGYLVNYTTWATVVAERMKDSTLLYWNNPRLLIQDNKVEVSVDLYSEREIASDIVAWVIEDSVRGVQALPDGSVDTAYYHRHMLRSAIGEVWGEAFIANPMPQRYMASDTLPEQCNPLMCSVVVLALDSNKKVLNAIQIRQ